MNRKHVLLMSALLLAVPAAWSQDTRGKIQGRVSDASDAVIVGAAVTLLNSNTGVSVNATSSANGQYLFDFVIPGTYSITVEMSGFSKFVAKDILVQARADITIDARLQTGSTRESITVEASAVAVQFNTSTMGLTIDTKMTNNLPIIHRNPFLLAALNPSVVVRSSTEQSPFHHWAASQLDVGGNTSTKNDIILDGSPSMTGQKSSYTPPMDAVSEVNLQQNAVDAEFGHSAGGVLSVSMKSGTNDYKGTAYYLGRNPALNALADRITRRSNLTRQHVWGSTFGAPIVKNKLFTFASYEAWRTIDPRSAQFTLPTDAERTGDFSRSLNTAGALRTIYDPWTTQVNNNVVTRTPFAGNIIPSSRIDPTGKAVIGDLWKANNPGTGPTGLNNFLAGFGNRFRYWNFSDRVDYNVSDKLKVFGRFNIFRTFTEQDDYTGGSPALQVDGSKRHSRSFSGDAVYALNATTVLNIRGAYNSIVDSFGVPAATLKDLEHLWPGNAWYKPYLADLPDLYYPGINVTQGSTTNLGRGNYWYQEPNSYNIESKMSKNAGKHYYKFGGEYRRENVNAARPRFATFNVNGALTNATFNSPNLGTSGDGWATLLLGAIDNNSNVASIPIQHPRVNMLGFFFHDDYKVTSKLTFNLGMRYEYFGAMTDPDNRFSRFLDLTKPISEFQGAGTPALPAAATALRTSAPVYNGSWVFADGSNRNSWSAPKGLFMPRVGVAYRVNDKMAIRAGFARYIVPSTLTDGLNILGSVPLPGFDAQTDAIAPIQGVPQQRLSNPFPNGLVAVVGKSLGSYTNLGGAGTWYQQNFHPGVNDRFNVSVQRTLPGNILADITWFMNLGRSLPYNWDVNQVDPRIGFAVQNAVNASVPNPFYNVLPATKMPGTLRTQANVAVSQFLRPYPQYQGLTETLRSAGENRYNSLQMQFQRPFVNGFNFVIGYNYNRERNLEFYDGVDNYLQNFTWQPATNARHRLTGAAIYELPFGKGRKFMGAAPRPVDAVLGGWAASGLFTYNSGLYLRFGGALASGDPGVDSPTQGRWFNTDVIKPLPAFTRRTNPLQYDSVKGPNTINADVTLNKMFPINERLKFEVRLEAYNVANTFFGANPSTDPNNAATFGRILSQRAGVFGRQMQFTGRFYF
ncbi:MAG: carboxypeptidase regulatory-like domain-containing protein [Acidobacteria bacterium]|nr:carboxypeptidase regulatory-like domain-containing protein [Acidobacteriota bacterium]